MVRRRDERKPLSFSTTLRNPKRIASFMEAILPFEGKILDNNVIHNIIKEVLKKKIYQTMPEKQNKVLKKILNDSELEFTDEQLEKIISISPQNHKEAGFDKGWPSRFDTWYKLAKEFGFVYYKIGEKIEISEAGYLLIKTLKVSEEEAAKQVQNIFLNALAKYQTNNPFRRNLIDNAPFILFLQVVRILENCYRWEKSGVYRSEISLITCWPNADAGELAEYINNFRSKYGKRPSNEIVYRECLKLLETTNENRFKIDQITKEVVDDFIRKFRITGLISLRGMGRLIDINKFESNKVSYLIDTYANYQLFEDEHEYYLYAGKIDNELIDIIPEENELDVNDIRLKTLERWAEENSTNIIDGELRILGTRNSKSNHELLQFIDPPTRFEFLTSIALKQQFPEIEVIPNYAIDDEGMPTFTARGGAGDIEVSTTTDDVLVEVTLMQNKSQAVNEIPGITRHLTDFGDHNKKTVYSIFIAPSLHPDTMYMIEFTKFKENLEINGYTIIDFLNRLRSSDKISDLRNIS
ncbi:AlwI family type II restriction endonuclease [Streptococcus equinus]|uniref:AlwI family type II restriction endonuclease n=1 Tax=Streptococcus equinus TaxID=1335 RepID=UPI0008C1ED16|nr:AlwI family type II restriction endonuclease [Streptococcus equinus]SEI52333.1 AlwI restriction endonuclease [Streptococcus equinus]